MRGANAEDGGVGPTKAVKEEEEEPLVTETLATRQEKACRKLARWRHVMEVPADGLAVDKVWEFVAAHVEDKRRKKACPLAGKAWRTLRTKGVAGHEASKAQETGGIPLYMPGHSGLRTKRGLIAGVKWSEKWVSTCPVPEQLGRGKDFMFDVM